MAHRDAFLLPTQTQSVSGAQQTMAHIYILCVHSKAFGDLVFVLIQAVASAVGGYTRQTLRHTLTILLQATELACIYSKC